MRYERLDGPGRPGKHPATTTTFGTATTELREK